MTDIIIIEKNGNIKQSQCKDFNNLFKSCGFRKSDGFELRHTWENLTVNKNKYNISVYARDTGKANTENKYDLPPPIDTDLYYGNLAIINKNQRGETTNLSLDEWNKIYEFLFGGFENLDDLEEEDENEEDELENIPSSLKTKVGGYLKDDFVVDDDDEDDEENDDLDDEESFINNSSDEDNIINSNNNEDEDEDELIEDCGSELDFEEYEYSDEN